MGKRHSPGCLCCRPCCSQVWDYVRADGASSSLTLNGVASGFPPVQSVNLVESSTSGGVTTYQCSFTLELKELFSSPPSSPRWYYTTEIVSGVTQYLCARAIVSVTVEACLPSPRLRVQRGISYAGEIASPNPDTTLTGLGYGFDGNPLDPFATYSYINTTESGTDFSTTHSVRNLTAGQSNSQFTGGGPWRYVTTVSSSRVITNTAQMLEFYSFPNNLAALFNPLSYSMDWDVL